MLKKKIKVKNKYIKSCKGIRILWGGGGGGGGGVVCGTSSCLNKPLFRQCGFFFA